jgi:hypothetical protein
MVWRKVVPDGSLSFWLEFTKVGLSVSASSQLKTEWIMLQSGAIFDTILGQILNEGSNLLVLV